MLHRKTKIFLALLILSLLAPTSLTHAQTPTPTARELLIQSIESRAQRDVELDAAPQTPSDLSILFGEQAAAVGMTMNDVKDIYDAAYQAATPVKSPWDDLLNPQGGWLYLIVGAALVILWNITKEYLEKLGKKLLEGTYQHLARFRPFWWIALRKYRQSLENQYRELKIPFRPGKPLQMQDVYVPLRVSGGSKEQIDAYQAVQKHQRLMVLGDPGSGKTMLLRHLAFTYSKQGLDDFPGQPIPLYLELNRLEGGTLFDALAKTLENNNFPGAKNFLEANLKAKSFLILLDGLDEVNPPSRPAIVKQVKDLWQKYPENRIIVTCRKAVYQGEFADWADQQLDIIDFTDQQIQRFMTSWQKDMPSDKSIEHFFRTLQERPQIMALARNPLLLTMIAYLYTDTAFALPHSRSEFYSRSTDLLLDQWKLERNLYKAAHKRLVLQHLALFNQEQSGQSGERRTMELSDILRETCAVLPDLTLKTEDAQPILDEIVQRSGLLLAIDGGQHYQFTHLTLQEYFAARALEANQEKLLLYYSAAPDAWREVVRLWCALEHDSTEMLKTLESHDPVMAFECLSGVQKVDTVYADELMVRFRPRLQEAVTNDALAAAFALLAADPRKRGRAWLNFLEQSLSDKPTQLASGAVLAQTNIPQAANVLVKLAISEAELRPFLTKVGNLAVPALKEAIQNDEIWAMDLLAEIGTPQAALVLEPFLWTDEPRAYHAAWRLAALLPLAGVEDALRTVTLSPEQQEAKQIEWIWGPFCRPDDKTLPIIVGRIAYLMHISGDNELPIFPSPYDRRLTLALCTIQLIKIDNETRRKTSQIIEEEYPMWQATPTILYLAGNEGKQKDLVDKYSSQVTTHPVWQHLYDTLPIGQQFNLLQFLVGSKIQPSVEDWNNLFRPLKYNFASSTHIKTLKLLWTLLLLLNLLGVWYQLQQSSSLMAWTNAGLIFVGFVMLGCWVWLLRREWNIERLRIFQLLFLAGFGPMAGAVTGGYSSSWILGVQVGTIVGAITGSIIFHIQRDDLFGLNIYQLIVIGGGIGGVSGGGLSLLFLPFSNELLIVFLIIGIVLVLFLVFLNIYSRNRESMDIYKSSLDALSSFIFLLVILILGSFLVGGLDIAIAHFATKLIFSGLGWTGVVVLWSVSLVSFWLLFSTGKRLERQAQNPLHGLLDPPHSPIPLRHSFLFLPRWLWRR